MTELEIRKAFAAKFIADETVPVVELSMDALIEIFDGELADAKRRWPTLNADREWMTMEEWLEANWETTH